MVLDEHFLRTLIKKNEKKILLMVMDGVGGIDTPDGRTSELAAAKTPNLDALAKESVTGRMHPLKPGITVGSGPGHLALFGYDPLHPHHQIGRGVMEALGMPGYGQDFALEYGDVAVRCNLAAMHRETKGIIDRRAGRVSSEVSARLVGMIQDSPPPPFRAIKGSSVLLKAAEQHRFVAIFRGQNLGTEVEDTDPQREGMDARYIVPILHNYKDDPSVRTAKMAEELLGIIERSLAAEIPDTEEGKWDGRPEELQYTALMRGFSRMPRLKGMEELYGLHAAAVAGYPLYRGVARMVGMKVLPFGHDLEGDLAVVKKNWKKYNFFFVHVKYTDSFGESGFYEKKVELIEQVDRLIPGYRELEPDVFAITADHSTPSQMKEHSWHPVPVLIHGEHCGADQVTQFNENACNAGGLGIIESRQLMTLMLATAGKLAKFGA